MRIVTREVEGTVVDIDSDTIMIRYDEMQRIDGARFGRVVGGGTINSREHKNLVVGDRVICKIQTETPYADEPLIAIRKIPEM